MKPSPKSLATESSDLALSRRLQRVLDAVEELFLTEGFLHLSTRDVALRLRCSKTSLYRLASTREGLFRLVFDRYVKQIRRDGRRAAEEATDWNGALRGFLDAAVVGLRRSSQAFLRDANRHPSTLAVLRDHQQRRMLDAEQLIRAGARAGAFRGVPPRILAEILFATVGRLSEPEVMTAVGLSPGEIYEEAYRIFEEGVLTPAGSRKRGAKSSLGEELRDVWPREEAVRPKARRRVEG